MGLINHTLSGARGAFLEWLTFSRNGCEKTSPLWLGDRDYAIWTVAFIGTWRGFSFNMVLCLADLTSVPRELYYAFYVMLSFSLKSPNEIECKVGGSFGAQEPIVIERCVKRAEIGAARPDFPGKATAVRQLPLPHDWQASPGDNGLTGAKRCS